MADAANEAGAGKRRPAWYWRVLRISLISNLALFGVIAVAAIGAHVWATSSEERFERAIVFAVRYVLTPASLVDDQGFKPAQIEPAVRLIEKIVIDGAGLGPRSDRHLYWQGRVLMVMPDVYKVFGRHEERVERGRRAIRIFADLAQRNPATTDYRRRLAVMHNIQAMHLADLGRHGEAIVMRDEAIAVAQQLLAREPGNWRWRSYVAMAQLGIGRSRLALADIQTALLHLEAARQISRELCQERPDDQRLCDIARRAQAAMPAADPTP